MGLKVGGCQDRLLVNMTYKVRPHVGLNEPQDIVQQFVCKVQILENIVTVRTRKLRNEWIFVSFKRTFFYINLMLQITNSWNFFELFSAYSHCSKNKLFDQVLNMSANISIIWLKGKLEVTLRDSDNKVTRYSQRWVLNLYLSNNYIFILHPAAFFCSKVLNELFLM